MTNKTKIKKQLLFCEGLFIPFLIYIFFIYMSSQKDPMGKRLCYPSVQMVASLNSFSSTVGMSPSSTNSFLLFLTRAVVKFPANRGLRKSPNRRVIALDNFVAIANSLSSERTLLRTHDIDSGCSNKSIIKLNAFYPTL